jgi:Leucine-rich repeat (LRR) protein
MQDDEFGALAPGEDWQYAQSVELVRCTHFPPGLCGQLTMVQQMAFRDCHDITGLPTDFGQLTSLQSLTLSGCCSLDGLPDSFSQLTSLRWLVLSRLAANSLPIWHLRHLQRLDIGYCLETSSIPGVVSQLAALTQLVVNGTAIETLPDEISKLSMLQELVMNDCEALSSLPGSLGQLGALTSLEISGSSLSELPEGLWMLPELKMLRVADCKKFAVVPAAIGRLSTLEGFDLRGCGSLTSLPNSMYRLTNLQALNLSDCTSLASLPPVLIALCQCSLKQIMLSNCSSLAGNLFSAKGIQRFDQLRELHLDGCSRLQMVDCLNSTSLTLLSLAGCSSLQVLPQLGGIANLRALKLTGCSSLQLLPDSLGALSNLVELDASDCSNLANLPGAISRMRALKRLELRSCNSLQTLPNDLPKLEWLDLSYCREMSALSEALIRIQKPLEEAGTTIALEGWRDFLSLPSTDGPVGLADTARLLIQPSNFYKLHVAINIEALIKDREFVLELLNRLSWLGVLLGAATFAGALAPPGGYDSGLLFADYTPADCRPWGANKTAPFTSLMYCNTSGPKQNCSISDADPGGCTRRPDQCSNIDGVSCNVKPNAAAVLSFVVCDVTSFGLSMALILLVVTCSIPPKRRAIEPAAAAGLIWMSLVLANYLLVGAVLFGLGAILSAMTAVLPVHELGQSRAAIMILGALILWILQAGYVRLMALSPGPFALQKAVSIVVEGMRVQCSVVLGGVMGLVRRMLASLARCMPPRRSSNQAPQGP